ncbi:MAG: hypothetical protein LBS58_02745 [Coriobacteriales bacterium]|jgi:MraZ protein|nr:hypothetical protein [Coriobacteriales bacterium]
MNGFYGENLHTMDAKGRVLLPAKFRKVLPESLVVVPSLDRDFPSLRVYTEDGFSQWKRDLVAKDGGYQAYNQGQEDLLYAINSSAAPVDIDVAGRISIPLGHRNDAKLDKEVVVVGNDDYIAVWNSTIWDAFKLKRLKSVNPYTS